MNSVETKPASNRDILSSLLILTGFIMLSLFVGQLLGFVAVLPITGFDLEKMTAMMTHPAAYPEAKLILLIMQAGATLFGFILAPILHRRLIDRRPGSPWFQRQSLDVRLLLAVIAISIAFMVANSVIIEWNMNIDLGRFSTSFEEWARAKEDQLSELTQLITRFDSPGGLLAGLVVIAVLPAIGEEIVFRGVLQRKLQDLTGNHHAAIWLAALLFSAIHLQFYGFFPRLLLGALFGYIYYWSGNLWYPVLAHLVNNGFILVMLYLYQQKATGIDMEATDAVPWSAALTAVVVGSALLFYFKRSFEPHQDG